MKNMHSFVKKSILPIILSLGLSMGFVLTAGINQAQAAGTTIGAINLNYIIANSKTAKAAAQRLERDYNARNAQIKPIVDRLDGLSEKLAAAQKNKATETAEFKKNEEDFLKLREEFAKKESQMTEEFENLKNTEDKKIRQEIDTVVKTIAAQEKIDVVIVAPIYASSNADITMKVLDILNK